MRLVWPLRSQAKRLFLVVAVPVHFWAISIYLLNLPNPEGAGGWSETLAIASYVLLFALLETAVIFLGLYLLAFLLPKQWDPEQRLGALVVLLLVVVVWAIVDQVVPLLTIPETSFVSYVRTNLSNTFLYRQLAYAGIFVFVIFTLIASVILGATTRVSGAVNGLAERFEVLAALYLFLDLGAFLVVLSRNV